MQESLDATYYETVDEMLPLCDYVMVSVCLTPDTTKMFGKKLFELMKPTSVFVNISRGKKRTATRYVHFHDVVL